MANNIVKVVVKWWPPNFYSGALLICSPIGHKKSGRIKVNGVARVLSRIDHLGEKPRPSGLASLVAMSFLGRSIILNEYALRCNLVHFETQF